MPPTASAYTLPLAALALTMAAGIIWRFAPLHLPYVAWKYGGSMLWASAVYWLLAALLPRTRTLTLALVAMAVSLLVELSRLTPQPTVDAFRRTLVGRLLLGRIYSPKNIAAYFMAIALTALAHQRLRSRP